MSNPHNLTEGALAIIMAKEIVPDPIMQVLMSKKINSGSQDKERYRLLLSDGKYTISFAMLTTQASSEGVETFSVIKLKKYITSIINNAEKGDQRVLLILEMDVITPGSKVGAKIGNPQNLSEDKVGRGSAVKFETKSDNEVKLERFGASSGLGSAGLSRNENLNLSISETKNISPISSLSPYHNNWVIKARVMVKSDIRTWSNSKGEGKLFSMDLMDDSGEIRCTAFRDVVDKFYDYLQVDKVYFISKCQLKSANKQFSTLKNDYEMTMSNETLIEECHTNDGSVPQVRYSFVPINTIETLEVGTLIDIIGVCKSSSDLQSFTSKTTNRELKKKELFLVDESKAAIALTLWGSQAENFEGQNNPVVVVKGAKVGEFGGGKNISCLMSSQLKVNPDIPESFRMKGWYDKEGSQADIKNLSERSGVGNFNTPWLTIKEVHDQGLGQSDRGDYYQLMGTVLLVRSENAVYKACPSAECNKKIVDLDNGTFKCEKCMKEYPNFKYRLLVSMNISDWTGNQWVNLFASEAEKILGKTSDEVGEALSNEKDAAQKIFDSANFKQFMFKCRAKMETYNDEQRLKTVVVKVDPLNFEEHNNYLVDRIQKFIA